MAVHKPSDRIVLHDNTAEEIERAKALIERKSTSPSEAEEIRKALGLDESER